MGRRRFIDYTKANERKKRYSVIKLSEKARKCLFYVANGFKPDSGYMGWQISELMSCGLVNYTNNLPMLSDEGKALYKELVCREMERPGAV